MRTIFQMAVAVAALALLPGAHGQTYQATWASTDKHTPSPEWFKDATFGIYWHWGAFTTPQFDNEWYGRHMYEPNSWVRSQHTTRYGVPEQWGYENFIQGKNDKQGKLVQFKPMLKTAGGSFDPAAWISLVKASGAKFAGPVAEHHDGFSMWNSSVNEWNSASKGPNIDLLKTFASLVRDSGLKVLVAMHHAFNTNGFYKDAPRQSSLSMQKLFGQLSKTTSDQLWFDKQREVVDSVQPDIIWNDFSLNSPGYCQGGSNICAIAEDQRLKFLAYYFNKAVDWKKEVLTTHKHFDPGFKDTSTVADYERGGPADIVRPYWLTDDSISASSWSYIDGMKYYSSIQMIHSLLDRVSKNGNMLLNISPTAAGVIPSEQEKVLRDIGAYLSRYGESVYNTRAWDVYGEGPTKAGGGSFTAPMLGNSNDLRFTINKAGDVLYAAVLGWPSSGKVTITSLGTSKNISLKGLKTVQLLGNSAGQYINITNYQQSSASLVVTLPAQPAASVAYVLKLTFSSGKVPLHRREVSAALVPAHGTDKRGVSLGEGRFSRAYLDDLSLAPHEIRALHVSDLTTVTVYSGPEHSGMRKHYGPGEHAIDAGAIGSIYIARV